MRKFILLLVMLVSVTAFSQTAYKGQGDQKISAGVNPLGNRNSLKLTYDYGISEPFSIGAGVSLITGGKYSEDFYIYARGDFHFASYLEIPRQWDLYTGAELGAIGSETFNIGFHIAARYAITNSIAVYTELGSNGAIGVSFSL
ncbi:hypothetical protein [Aureivirga sp. CE67]|uniref:hypothetical protein n=1 Tax=Aureivirga sp. CE67 TaxID=1788983 RepID=UPI0018CB0652|nr:hypothetical protein [Aureivirga sp. CE67]